MKYAVIETIMDRGTIIPRGSMIELTNEQAAALGDCVMFVPMANATAPLSTNDSPSAPDAPPSVDAPTGSDATPTNDAPTTANGVPPATNDSPSAPDAPPSVDATTSKPSSKSEKK